MAESSFWDLSASDVVGGYLSYQTAKAAAKPAAPATTTATPDGPVTDGKTTPPGAAPLAGVPQWAIFAGLGVLAAIAFGLVR